MQKINKKFKKIKIIAWYELTISFLIALFSLFIFIVRGFLDFRFFISLFGIIGSTLILNNSKKGFYLSLTWAFLQIFIVQIGDLIINLTQGIYLTLAFIGFTKFETFPNVFFSPNLIGIIILILLIIWRKEILNKNE